jgi:hypothetical protein
MKHINPKSVEIAIPLCLALVAQLVVWVCVFWALLTVSEINP